MASKVDHSSGLGPAATPQGWFTLGYWSAFFRSFFASIGSYFWTSSDPIKAFPFPEVVTLSNVQEWLGNIKFETNLELIERDISTSPTDQISQRIDDLRRVVALVTPHIPVPLPEASEGPMPREIEDWTPISGFIERVRVVEAAVLDHKPRYLPMVEGPPASTEVQETFGLGNPRNDCFMNATLQMIFSSPYLVEHIVYGEGQQPIVQQVYEQWKDYYVRGDFSSPKLANVLRSLDGHFQGSGQHDANEFLMALVRPLKREGNPIFYKREERTKYKDLQIDELEEEPLFREGYKVKEEFANTIQLILSPEANHPLIHELIAETYVSSHVDEGKIEFKKKEGGIVKVQMEERMFLMEPPRFLFVDVVRHQVASQQFRDGGRFTGAKNGAQIGFQQYFYIPPEQTLDGRGAKYEWISYAVQGGSFGGGHYTANVKHQSGIHYYSDDYKSPKSDDQFLIEGQNFYLGFARRVDTVETDILVEMAEARSKGESDKMIGTATAGKIGESKMLGLIKLFSDHLDTEVPDLHLLQKVYDKLDDRFREFVATFLPESPRDRLIELKAVDQQLGTELSGNIVAQYAKIREQNIRIARDLKREKVEAEAEKGRLEHLSTIVETNERLRMAKILDPGLEKVLPAIPVETLLETNALQLELIARLEAIEALRSGR